MAKKQFIRHLEFYGFPDQNAFTSETDIPSSEGKADKKDLDALSAKTDTFISAQSTFNDAQTIFNEDVEKEISGITDCINTIGEFIVSISGISDDVETLSNAIDDETARAISAETALDEKIDSEIIDVKNDVKTYITTKVKKYVDDADEELQNQINEIKEQYSGLCENIDENYYTKEEIDEKIPSGLSSYATIEQLDNVHDELIADIEDEAARATSAETALDEKIDMVISAETALDEKIDSEVGGIRTYINTVVRNYIDNADRELQEQIDTKADKDVVDAISGTIESIESDVEHSKEAVQAFSGIISAITEEVESAITEVQTYNTRISSLESDFVIEVDERKQADLDIIGTSSDTKDDNSIFGARAYANEMRRQAINSAITYTDESVATFETMVVNLSANTQQWLTSAATTSYVDSRINNVKRVLRDEFTNGINDEQNRAEQAESQLLVKVNDCNTRISANTNDIAHNATRINALTEWDGSNPEDYESWASAHTDASGIVDVMHREIHEIDPQAISDKIGAISGAVDAHIEDDTIHVTSNEKLTWNAKLDISDVANFFDVAEYDSANKKIMFKHGSDVKATIDASDFIKDGMVDNVKVEDGKLKIIFNTESGKEEIDIELTEIFNPDNYYTKDDVDALLLAKENEIYNLTKIVGDMGGAVTYELPNAAGKSFNTLMSNNGTVKLTDNITCGRFGPGITAKNHVSLNLNSHNLTISGLTTTSTQPAIMSRGTQEITIGGNGIIDAGQGVCIEANSKDSIINLTGSTTVYQNDRSGAELIYCYAGTINITNGTFKNLGTNKTFMINCYDANYRNGTANIIVTGGKFYDFNPADNSAEGEHTSFVPSGYHVEASTDGDSTVYTVKKD